MRKNHDKITCIDGHHRATAMTLAKIQNKQIDFTNTPVTIALAELSEEESDLLDEIIKRGIFKN